jgi:uncharacterized protein (TIGR00299 family) protein
VKTLHFECFAGISGDMALGAFVDLGVNPETLIAELKKLRLDGWALRFERDERCGITGVHAVVELGDRHDHHAHDHEHDGHEHFHLHTNTGHGHQRLIETEHGGHSHNSWKEIRALIEAAPLSPGAKTKALDIFSRIAKAESEVHGVGEDDIAFHEVGAMDSIIDIVGAAVCLDLLKPDRVTCSEIELGGGTVRCAHGVLPVPAPATVIICRGLPVRTGGFDKEMTTPTGAAILASCVDEFISAARFREIKTGYGIGTRRMEKPNVLRVSWREESAGESSGAEQPWNIEERIVLEANIDDMSGEALGFLMDSLFGAGALDVTFTPCAMKKGRPGTVVSVLTAPETLNAIRETLFKKSSTIGFREIPVRRLSLKREEENISGGFGEARQKTVFYGGERLRSKIEYDDRARLARDRGVSLEEAERIIKDGK